MTVVETMPARAYTHSGSAIAGVHTTHIMAKRELPETNLLLEAASVSHALRPLDPVEPKPELSSCCLYLYWEVGQQSSDILNVVFIGKSISWIRSQWLSNSSLLLQEIM